MADDINKKDSQFLTELSNQEQETVAGGFNLGKLGYFFFQQTDIESIADHQTNISGGNNGVSGSSSSKAGYRFSQTTLASGSLMFGMGRTRSRGYNWMSRFFSSLFGEDDWTG